MFWKLENSIHVKRKLRRSRRAAALPAPVITGKLTGYSQRQNQLDDWDETRGLAREGTFDEIRSDHFIRYYATIKRIRIERPVELQTLQGELENQWFFGRPGTGKSRRAREENPGAYIKPINKWWDLYDMEDVVIIDEWEPDNRLGFLLKLWADRYPFVGECKFGSRMMRPRKIIVTSNYTIEQCFNCVDAEAVKRRFNVVNF